MATQRFPLQSPPSMPRLIALFSLGTVVFAVAFAIDDPGARFDALGATASRVLYGVLCACCLATVVIMLVGKRARRGGRIAIELDDEAIVIPNPIIRSRTRRFLFAEITSAKVFAFRGHEVLMIVGAPGRRGVARSELSPAAFDTIVAAVNARVPAVSMPVAKVR